jgi:hypothetical protein
LEVRLTTPKVVVSDPLIGTKARRAGRAEPVHAWRYLAGVSAVLAGVGLGDVIIAFIPLRFGTIEWEFATMASVFAGLPLIAMGLFGMLAAGLALPSRALAFGSAVLMALLATAILAGFVVFLTDAPIALASVPETVAIGIKKAIAKTALLAVAFSLTFYVAAISAMRHLIHQRKNIHA